MYGLRSINNMFSEFAGHRSDFVIIGHPEFQHGKIRSCTRGLGAGWDTRPTASHPRKSLARSRTTSALLGDLTAAEPKQPLKTRALDRAAVMKAKAEVSAPISQPGYLGLSFDAFWDELVASTPQESAVVHQMPKSAASHAKSNSWQPACRHFTAVENDIDAIKKRVQDNPGRTRQYLLDTGSWKYFANHMEQAKRIESHLKRECERNAPAVMALSLPPVGRQGKTH